MIGPIINHKKKLLQICKKKDVVFMAIFGSGARGDSAQDSDTDLLVRFSKPKSLLGLRPKCCTFWRLISSVNLKAQLIRLFFIAIFAISFIGCDVVGNYGLKKYFLGFIKPHDIKIKEISSKTSGRRGYFLFEIDTEEFSKMKMALNLKEAKIHDTFNGNQYILPEITDAIRRCDSVENFHFKNPRYNPDDFNTWGESPFLPDVKVYIAEPPLAPMEGNSRSSFDFLIYNTSTKQGCALLQYPYG